MNSRVLRFLIWAFVLACAATLPCAMLAQDAAKPASKAAASDSPSKWDIFLGYSYLAPHGTVTGVGGVPNSYQSIDWGGIVSGARYFNNYFGVQVEGDEHTESEDWFAPGNPTHNTSSTNANDDFAGGSAGLIFRFPTADITPFVHALVGSERVGSIHQDDKWGAVVTAGGGLDYSTPWFDHHLAIRVFQADYQYTHENFGLQGRGNFNMARLSAGVVWHVGTIAPPPPVTLACSANPTSVFPGDPVTVTATAGSLDPKLNAVYSWTGTGVTGNGTTASVATASLAPGSYTVKGDVKEGKKGHEGLKPWEVADCTASFTVKAYEPPTISCSASPSTIKPGESSTITAVGMSPQNRPLTYSYSATAGSISGTGTTAIFSSTGAPTGPVGITCNVADDKGQTATASTGVTITAPYVPPAPHTQALCSITFDKDKKRPTRVDNDAKACLDEVALDLQKQSDATAVVVGEATAAEMTPKKGHKHAKVEDIAAQRAVNTKDYLVKEKGIDASRISVATGTTNGQRVEDYIVPSGASFTADVSGTTPVNESVVKPEERKPLGEKHHAHKKAAAAPAQ
jgi:outer membrane protein OmpA-like peptidoglycan-associated protein